MARMGVRAKQLATVSGGVVLQGLTPSVVRASLFANDMLIIDFSRKTQHDDYRRGKLIPRHSSQPATKAMTGQETSVYIERETAYALYIMLATLLADDRKPRPEIVVLD